MDINKEWDNLLTKIILKKKVIGKKEKEFDGSIKNKTK